MNPEDAQWLFHHGAFIIMLDTPSHHLQVGIDGVSWRTGPLFKGLKMIPPGVHFVSWQIVREEDEGGEGILGGLFKHFKSKEVVGLQWDHQEEQFNLIDVDHLSLYDLDRFLGPYPFDKEEEVTHFRSWISITKEATLRVLFPSGLLTSTDEQVHFTKLPSSRKPDRTDILRSLPNQWVLLEELQISFVLLVLGHNYSGFEQWVAIVELLCHSTSQLTDQPRYFVQLLEILTAQLEHCPDEFFTGIGLHQDSTLYGLLNMLVVDCIDSQDDNLSQRAGQFADLMMERFGWDLRDAEETGEYAPTIVVE